MLLYNTNEKFGEAGPFETVDREYLADQYEETFMEWAIEKVQKMLHEGHEFDPEETPEADFAAQFRAEFIAGLEEVE